MSIGCIGLSHSLASIRWQTFLVGIMGLEEESERGCCPYLLVQGGSCVCKGTPLTWPGFCGAFCISGLVSLAHSTGKPDDVLWMRDLPNTLWLNRMCTKLGARRP
ncbi:anthrax toxin receptor 2 [Platysternon megacephalum]|uniref:Anthrax toxin receptor 2 n=1 Tax=Platysternon megacephalum TaxID=55544 RepID=A0A4D9E9M9_9SAUR|nr:anthrax toxin receptor 2 [Platysternon megacephalum]